jgi:GR25 family glycosyltransferase involved in LPS biosynthesis
MFDKIFYINLQHRKDRNQNVTDQLIKINKYNISERLDAVYGVNLNIQTLPSNLITDKGKEDALNDNQQLYTYLTKGAVGCALSHRKAYEKIIKDNIKAALILEDDITFDDNFNEKLKVLEKNILIDYVGYDILYLGYSSPSLYNNNVKINDYFMKPVVVYGLFGYIVTNNGAKKLLDIFPITSQIDTEISNNFNKINAYIVTPENRIIFSDPSSIDTKFGTDIQVRTNQVQVLQFASDPPLKNTPNIDGMLFDEVILSMMLMIIIILLIFVVIIIYLKINNIDF